jgi:hypothetical protein
MNNLPFATDNDKQYNTRGPVVNDSLMKYSNPNKSVSHVDEPVVQDSLTSFDHLLKEKVALNANKHRHKRNKCIILQLTERVSRNIITGAISFPSLNINIVKQIFPQRIFEAVAIGGFRNQEQPQKIQIQEQAKSTRHTK